MERRVEEFLHTEPAYISPYSNHYGYGKPIGCGDNLGRGRAFVKYMPDNNYNNNGIVSFNDNNIIVIDGYVLYITHVHGPWAMGEIIKNDLTTQTCYLTKVNNTFVVDSSLKDVIEQMREKIFKNKENDDDIARAFVLAHPEYKKEYDWDEMVAWHSLSPTSCADGRRRFSKLANKKSGETATPEELIRLMKNSPSKNIALKMEEIYLSQF